MSNRLLTAAFATAFLAGAAVPALADTSYGAIATSTTYYGLYTNASNKDEAQRKALAACTRLAKKNDETCAVKVWFTKCGAVAENDKYVAWGIGSTEREAKAAAMRALKGDGDISASGCNEE